MVVAPMAYTRKYDAHAFVGRHSGVSVFDTRIDLLDLVKMTGGPALRPMILTPSLAGIVAVCREDDW